MPTKHTPGLTSLSMGLLIVKTKRHHYSIMSAQRKEGPSWVPAKNRNQGRTRSIKHQRTRSTHRKDTTICVRRNRAPFVTTFISPLLCRTCDGVDKENSRRKSFGNIRSIWSFSFEGRHSNLLKAWANPAKANVMI